MLLLTVKVEKSESIATDAIKQAINNSLDKINNLISSVLGTERNIFNTQVTELYHDFIYIYFDLGYRFDDKSSKNKLFQREVMSLMIPTPVSVTESLSIVDKIEKEFEFSINIDFNDYPQEALDTEYLDRVKQRLSLF